MNGFLTFSTFTAAGALKMDGFSPEEIERLRHTPGISRHQGYDHILGNGVPAAHVDQNHGHVPGLSQFQQFDHDYIPAAAAHVDHNFSHVQPHNNEEAKQCAQMLLEEFCSFPVAEAFQNYADPLAAFKAMFEADEFKREIFTTRAERERVNLILQAVANGLNWETFDEVQSNQAFQTFRVFKQNLIALLTEFIPSYDLDRFKHQNIGKVVDGDENMRAIFIRSGKYVFQGAERERFDTLVQTLERHRGKINDAVRARLTNMWQLDVLHSLDFDGTLVAQVVEKAAPAGIVRTQPLIDVLNAFQSEEIQQYLAMGFDQANVIDMLVLARGNPTIAIQYLMGDAERPAEEAAMSEEDEVEVCGMCMDEDNVVNFQYHPCGHRYCGECIQQWGLNVHQQQNPTCPMCRQPAVPQPIAQ